MKKETYKKYPKATNTKEYILFHLYEITRKGKSNL